MSAVTLLEAKAHLRVLHTADDAYIQDLVDAAVAQAEEITSRNLLETVNIFYLDGFVKSFELPKSPLIAIDTIEYQMPDSETYTTLSATAYRVNDVVEPAKVLFKESFSVADSFKSIKVTYRAGYAPDAVPKPIKQWVLIRVATMYENREEVAVGTVSEIRSDYNDFFISKYRVGRL